ncbi:MAG: hypothetical protein HY520_04335 [Candidatus Aenigmarchaeota archaeon]|nr:hypothetical protein [Candidatus Aenigmarchaeota archaeon]
MRTNGEIAALLGRLIQAREARGYRSNKALGMLVDAVGRLPYALSDYVVREGELPPEMRTGIPKRIRQYAYDAVHGLDPLEQLEGGLFQAGMKVTRRFEQSMRNLEREGLRDEW